MKNIVLIGFMGSGKSTLGKYLAKKYNMKQIDTDWYIENKYNMAISDIFNEYGETRFREMETECINDLINDNGKYIVSVGGGLPVKEVNRPLLKKLGFVVYLKATVDTLEKRLSGDTKRPLLQGGSLRDKITNLMEQRETIYEEVADLIVNTDNKKFEEIEELIKAGM